MAAENFAKRRNYFLPVIIGLKTEIIKFSAKSWTYLILVGNAMGRLYERCDIFTFLVTVSFV